MRRKLQRLITEKRVRDHLLVYNVREAHDLNKRELLTAAPDQIRNVVNAEKLVDIDTEECNRRILRVRKC